jgi:hypothetical protein
MSDLFKTTSTGISISNNVPRPFYIAPYGVDGAGTWETGIQGAPEIAHDVYVDVSNGQNGHASLRVDGGTGIGGHIEYVTIKNIGSNFTYSFLIKYDKPIGAGDYVHTYLRSSTNLSDLHFCFWDYYEDDVPYLLVKVYDATDVVVLSYLELLTVQPGDLVRVEIKVTSAGGVQVYMNGSLITEVESSSFGEIGELEIYNGVSGMNAWFSEISIQNT